MFSRIGYKKSDIEDLTQREFYELLDLIQKQAQIDYMQDLTKFAWLGQVINGMFGGKTDLYKEATKQLDKLVTSFTEKDEDRKELIDEWKEIAQQRGIKFTSKKEV